MRIFCKTQEEYRLAKESFPSACISSPDDSYAITVWSIDDIRDKLPEDTNDDILRDIMDKLCRNLEEVAVTAGWEAINWKICNLAEELCSKNADML